MVKSIKSELPTEIAIAQTERLINSLRAGCSTSELGLVDRLLRSRRYGAQEKHNGERLTICKQGTSLRTWNREGEPSAKKLPAAVVRALLAHPMKNFAIDVELVKPATIFVLDAYVLEVDGLPENLDAEFYEYREARIHAEFDYCDPHIVPVTTYRDELYKRQLIVHLWDTQAEGVVFHDMDALFMQGRSEQHYKLKFWKELDAFVIAPSPEGKDSVRIGVFDQGGKVVEISGCSLSSKKHPHVGDVLKVKYLYAAINEEGERHIVQPAMLGIRTDKSPMACTIDQLVVNKNFIGRI